MSTGIPTNSRFDWTDAADSRLRAYWHEGLTTAAICDRLGCSKNAVVGRAHRLNLPGRPSPIIRSPLAQRPKRIPRAPVVTPPVVVRTVAVPPVVIAAPVAVVAPVAPPVIVAVPAIAALPTPAPAPPPAPPKPPAPTRTPAPAPAPPPLRVGNSRCQFPSGDPRTDSFRFCNAPAVVGRPYCEQCLGVAYIFRTAFQERARV